MSLTCLLRRNLRICPNADCCKKSLFKWNSYVGYNKVNHIHAINVSQIWGNGIIIDWTKTADPEFRPKDTLSSTSDSSTTLATGFEPTNRSVNLKVNRSKKPLHTSLYTVNKWPLDVIPLSTSDPFENFLLSHQHATSVLLPLPSYKQEKQQSVGWILYTETSSQWSARHGYI